MREQQQAVPEDCRCRSERWRVVPNEQRDWTEPCQNDRGDGEAHQNREGGLSKGKTRTENLREHSIHDRVAGAGQKDQQWKLDRGIERLQRRTANSQGKTVEYG